MKAGARVLLFQEEVARTFSASAKADSASAAAVCAEASSRRISASSDAAASLAVAASRRAAAASPSPPLGFDTFDVRCPESDLLAGPAQQLPQPT